MDTPDSVAVAAVPLTRPAESQQTQTPDDGAAAAATDRKQGSPSGVPFLARENDFRTQLHDLAACAIVAVR